MPPRRLRTQRRPRSLEVLYDDVLLHAFALPTTAARGTAPRPDAAANAAANAIANATANATADFIADDPSGAPASGASTDGNHFLIGASGYTPQQCADAARARGCHVATLVEGGDAAAIEDFSADLDAFGVGQCWCQYQMPPNGVALPNENAHDGARFVGGGVPPPAFSPLRVPAPADRYASADRYVPVVLAYDRGAHGGDHLGLTLLYDGHALLRGAPIPGWAPQPSWRFGLAAKSGVGANECSVRRLRLRAGAPLEVQPTPLHVTRNGQDYEESRAPFDYVYHGAPIISSVTPSSEASPPPPLALPLSLTWSSPSPALGPPPHSPLALPHTISWPSPSSRWADGGRLAAARGR